MRTIHNTQTKDQNSLPLVSFIVTDYNIPPGLLRDCIASILALSLREDEREIILVDDGSDMAPLEELTGYLPHILYIRQDNRGLSSARNTGLRMAKGQYIQFVDGDDCLIRAPYEHCLDIVRYKRPDIVTFFSTDKNVARTPLELDTPVTGSSYMRKNNLRASACCYIFSRATLGSLRFPDDIPTHEDEDFTPQLFLRAERLFATNAQAYFYRKRQGSITNNRNADHINSRLAYMERVILHLQSLLDSLPDTDKPALNRRIAQLTMDYLYNIITQSRNRKTLDGAIARLESHGLFPLPAKDYTAKYKYFVKIMNNRVLRSIVTAIMTR